MAKPRRAPSCHELNARLKVLEADYARLLRAVVILTRCNQRMMSQADRWASAPLLTDSVKKDA